MTYDEVVAHLDALQMHKIKLGLGAMRDFLEKVGRPESRLRTVHLAGTNGKGTVCAGLSKILGLAGYRVGVYTSPHLSCVRERFRIGSEYISEESFARLGSQITDILGEDQITYFEFTTALGFLWFAESDVDLVLLETGMGGRLDATNVVTPIISVITSVSMDHEAYLGETLEEIAGEKAGIIKEKVPVVSGAVHPDAAKVVEEVCALKNAELFVLGRDFDYTLSGLDTWAWSGGSFGGKTYQKLISNSPSLVQQDNESLVLAVLSLLDKQGMKVTEENIYKGLSSVKWPGRMEYLELTYPLKETEESAQNVSYLLDGAHNPAGVENLTKTLEQRFSQKRLIGVWGSMIDKDLTGTLEMIVPLLDTFIITQPDGERSATPEQIYTLLDDAGKQKTTCVAGVQQALTTARKTARQGDLIVVGGSLYLIGAARQILMGDLI